jgi:hypothetical protein
MIYTDTRTSLFKRQPSPLINPEALTEEDWDTLAWLISQRYAFHFVRGAGRWGIKLAKVLEQYGDPEGQHLMLLVDVVYDGPDYLNALRSAISYEPVTGVVVFAHVEPPAWIQPIMRVW